jgi:hypothetical protein
MVERNGTAGSDLQGRGQTRMLRVRPRSYGSPILAEDSDADSGTARAA